MRNCASALPAWASLRSAAVVIIGPRRTAAPLPRPRHGAGRLFEHGDHVGAAALPGGLGAVDAVQRTRQLARGETLAECGAQIAMARPAAQGTSHQVGEG